MMWSNASTNKRLRAFRSRFLLFSLLAGLIGAAGCATEKTAPPPPLRGSVNLAVLVQRHPGWRGVRQYDEALRRLQAAAGQSSGAARPGASLGVLPPETGLNSGGSLAPSDARLDQAQGRLEGIERTRLERLRARREAARGDQLAENRSLWTREARTKFPLPEPDDSGPTNPDLQIQLLRLNIQTLTDTYNSWNKSKRPAPDLEALRGKIAEEQNQLSQMTAQQAAQQKAIVDARRTALARVRQARAQYVETQSAQTEAALYKDDEALIAHQQGLLSAQLASLMRTGDAKRAGLVPAAGSLGAQSLSALSTPNAALNARSIQSAQAHLQAQRSRWVAFLYDDTRAAAQDAAGQKHWQISFAAPQPGERDLTGPLAQALADTVWRVADARVAKR